MTVEARVVSRMTDEHTLLTYNDLKRKVGS